jgi:hypothetical protein
LLIDFGVRQRVDQGCVLFHNLNSFSCKQDTLSASVPTIGERPDPLLPEKIRAHKGFPYAPSEGQEKVSLAQEMGS